MQTRQLGQSEVHISRIVLGTWAIGGWMWGGTDEQESVRAIEIAIDEGMTTIDTAPIYGFGLAEELVGQAVRGKREQVQIATKAALRWDRTDGQFFFDTKQRDGTPVKVYRVLKKDAVIEECERSLTRLGTDYIDLYQCHWMDPTTPIQSTMEGLLELQQQGKIRAIGVSNFTVEAMEECLQSGRIESDQPEYSLMYRLIEDKIVPWCQQHQISLLAYSPMYNGLLTGKVTPDREFGDTDLRRWNPWLKPENWHLFEQALRNMESIANDHHITLAQLALAWVLHQPGLTAALAGARNPQQVQDNARASEVMLSKEECDRLAETFKTLTDRIPPKEKV